MRNGPRRWLRYSLRTFFVLVTLFAVWLGVQVKWIRQRDEALKWIRKHGGYDADVAAPLSLRVLGQPGISLVRLETFTVEQDELETRKKELGLLFPEARFILQGPALRCGNEFPYKRP